MGGRIRMLVSFLVAVLAAPAALVGGAGPAGGAAPARVQGTLPCETNSSGQDTVPFVAPLTGVAVFDGFFPVNVTNITGGSEHETLGGASFVATVAGTSHTIEITGPPSTICSVFYAVDSTPSNDDVTAAEPLTGLSGTVQGSTRAATRPVGEPAPTAGAQRVVWYSWSGPTGTATFTAEPLVGGGHTDPANGATATGVAVFDAANPQAPLQVGGDGIASQDGGGDGGTVTLPVLANTEYLVAVFSAGGTGIFAGQFGYIAPGAFDLTWNVNSLPIAQDDLAQTASGTTVTIDVLANDTDPDGDTLDVSSFTTTNPFSSVGRDSSDPNLLVYEPAVDVDRYDYFTYEVTDDDGHTDTALVTVYVDVRLPAPAEIAVTPSPVDFGAVPLGKAPEIELTIENVGQNAVGPFFFEVVQREPRPFESDPRASLCAFVILSPGDECTQPIRFWSVTDADAASPATLEIRPQSNANTVLLTVPLLASTAPPVPPGSANTAPDAVDDIVGVATGFDHTIRALYNDSDPDEDQLTVTGASGAQHGTLGPVVPCWQSFAGSPFTTCVRYTPDPGFIGVDEVDYTVSDGRGGTDTATIYFSVASFTDRPTPRIDTLTPDHGPAAGGHAVTIDGANYLPGATVTFTCNGVDVAPDATFVSTTQLTVTMPALAAGAVCDVTVRQLFNLSGTSAAVYTVDGSAPPPTVIPGGASVVEGNGGSKTMNVGVRLSAPSTQTVTVQWTTLQLTGATNADGTNDYAPASGVVTFAPGETTKTVPVVVNGDLLDEPDEFVFVAWHNATNAVVGGFFGTGYGIIRDDDPPPRVLPGAAAIAEGNAGATTVDVPVSLSAASGGTVTVQWTTLPHPDAGFADATNDYTPASGVVTFAPGETTKTVPVAVNGDTVDESDEYIVVSFRNPVNAVMGGFWGLGFGVIQDDD